MCSNACVICKNPGLLLCCDGKDCKRSYHLSCIDPPLKDIPVGVWLCLLCVKKKMVSGVYSVSEGIESVLDIKEGMQNGSHYLVKYKGLAHVHNRWIPESQILLEAPTLLAKFNRGHQKEKVIRWKREWTEPQRLLQRRLLMPLKLAGEYFSGHVNNNSYCYHEWLVKWKGLGYEHATWEFENAPFLCSPEAISLIKNYESRQEVAMKISCPSRANEALQVKKNAFHKLLSLPDGLPPRLDNDHLNSINRLREFWHRSQNAVFVDEQERIIKSILLILALQSHTCRPFLIISTLSSLSVWESEFARLAPTVNLVIYSGNTDVRKIIREVEFYEEGGCILFQVLLSHPDAIVEDFGVIDCIGWEAMIVDECQNSRVSRHFEKLKHLSTDFRLLLLSGLLKDSLAEYLNLLSFLESGEKEDCVSTLKFDSKDTVGVLATSKERLSHYLAYERKPDSSKFVEYWVPVRLSNVQLEQYCATLVSNSITLRSCSKIDHVGALRDIVISSRKCCDHPYLVDPSLQSSLTKDLPAGDYLDVGVNASGKLILLDKILQEIKNEGLRVLILFQSIGGAGRNSIGDILDDFLRQRFGADSYERVDSGLIMSKKLAAFNMFNDKARGRFVFLIENRACRPSIKLSSIDAAIIFDSDWNPLNDLRALQKISIESQFEYVKVFRLYSSCTVEEKVLILAKQDMILESNIQSINRSVSHSLLSWGASYLFFKLEEFHQQDKLSNYSETSPDIAFLNDVMSEVLSKLLNKGEGGDTRNCSFLINAQHSGVSYSRNVILVGEKEGISSLDKDPPSFWSNILERRYPQWKYISQSSQRSRRKVSNLDELAKVPEAENDEGKIKRRKLVRDTVNSHDKTKEATCKDTLPVNLPPSRSSSQSTPTSTKKMLIIPEASPSQVNVGSASMLSSPYGLNHAIFHAQRNLRLLLKPELSKLCENLKFPEDVKSLAETLLEYVMNNHHVSPEPKTILHALILSLCWRAASLLKHTLDRRESLVLAKKYMNFECDEDQAYSVYLKLRILKKKFAHRRGVLKDDSEPLTSLEKQSLTSRKDASKEPLCCQTSKLAQSYHLVREGDKTRDRSDVPWYTHDLIEEEQGNAKAPAKMQENIGSLKDTLLKKRLDLIGKICSRREEELNLKQQVELSDFNIHREAEKMKLKRAYESELGVTQSIIHDSTIRNYKMKVLNQEFSRKVAAFDQNMKFQRRKLAVMQADARNKERQIKDRWLEEAKAGRLAESFDDIPLSDSGFLLEGYMGSKIGCEDLENAKLASGPGSDHLCHDVNPAGRAELIQSTVDFSDIPPVIPNGVVNNLSVVTEPSDSQCNNMNILESEFFEPIGISTGVPATVPSGVASMSIETEPQETLVAGVAGDIPNGEDEDMVVTKPSGSQCNNMKVIESESFEPIGISTGIRATVPSGVACEMSIETESQTIIVAGVAGDVPNREDGDLVVETEAPASQCKNINAVESVEPAETSLPNTESVLPGMSGDLPMETVSSAFLSDIVNEEGNMQMLSSSRTTTVSVIEKTVYADASCGPCLTFSLQGGADFPSSANALTSFTCENSRPNNQVPCDNVERLDVSDSMRSDQAISSPQIAVPLLNSVDCVPSQIEHAKHNEAVKDSLQQMPLPTDIILAEHYQGETPGAAIASDEEPSHQTNFPNQQNEVTITAPPSQVDQSAQVASPCDVNALQVSATTPGGTFSEDVNSNNQIHRSTHQNKVLMQQLVLDAAMLVERGNRVVSHDVCPTTTPGISCSEDLSSTYYQITRQTDVSVRQPTLSSAEQVEQSDQVISHDVDDGPSHQRDFPNQQNEVAQVVSLCDVNPLPVSATTPGGTVSEDVNCNIQIHRSTHQNEVLMQQPVVDTTMLVEQGNQVVSHDLRPTTTPGITCNEDLSSTYCQTSRQTDMVREPTLSSAVQVEQSDQVISHDVDAASSQETFSGVLGSTCHQTHCSTGQAELLTPQSIAASGVYVDQSNQLMSQTVVHSLPPSVTIPSEQTQSDDPSRTIVQRDCGSRFLQNLAMMNWIPSQGLHSDPLQNELIKIGRQKDLCIKMQEDKKLRLKLESDMEIEMVRRKYDALLQDAESEFLRDKKILDTIYNKVLMNRVLAEQFRARFIENKGGVSSSLQGSRSSYLQHLLHASQPQHAPRPSSATSSALHSTSFPIPVAQPSVAVSAPAPAPSPSSLPSSRLWAPATSIASAQVAGHTPSTAFSSNPIRSHFSPTFSARASLQVGSEPRAPAPHLHRFRPHPSISTQSLLQRIGGITCVQQPLSNAAASASYGLSLVSPLPPTPPSTAPGGQGTLPLWRGPSLSPVDLPPPPTPSSSDAGDSPVGAELPNLATEYVPGFDTLFSSNLAPAGLDVPPASSDATRPSATSDVVYISDDE